MGSSATWLRRALQLTAVFVVLTFLFVVGLTAVFSLPRAPIRAHVADSVPLIEAEGTPYRPILGIPSYQVDNYTDALMLNIALGKPGDNPVKAAMADVYAMPPGMSDEEMGTNSTTLPLLKAAVADQYANTFPYARYWHGYLLALRPALLLFSYQAIRFISIFLLAALVLGIAVLLTKRIGAGVAFGFVGSLLWVGGILFPMSLQFSSVFLLALVAALGILVFGDRRWFKRWDLEIFLGIGMLTAFLDLLTAPLVTLGIPLLVLLLVRQRTENGYSWRSGLLDSVGLSIAWGAGYALSWSSKWVIGSAILGWNVLAQALGEAAYWSGNSGPMVAGSTTAGAAAHSLGSLGSNLAMLVPLFGIRNDMSGLQTDVVVATVLVAALVFAAIVAIALRFHRPWREWLDRLPLLAVGTLPYLWYLVIRTHSAQHFWFTYRVQAITLFALSAFLLTCTDTDAFAKAVRSLPWVRRVMEYDAPQQ